MMNQMSGASPAPIALMKNNPAAIFITAIRPIRSAIRPAVSAPIAAPINADATAIPSTQIARPEGLLHGVVCAVDHSCVVTEQQPSECGDRGYANGAATRGEFLVFSKDLW